MKLVKEFFNNHERESAQNVEKLNQHLATWPTVKAEFDRLDNECIPIAREVAALHFAGSPRAIEVSVNLQSARMRRDNVKRRYQVTLDELRRKSSACTQRDIDNFHLNSLDFVKNLGTRYYRFRRDSTVANILTDKKTVRISSNIDALEAARDRVFAGIKEIRGMEFKPLAEVRARILELETEFASFRFAEMHEEEVSPMAAIDMKPHSPAIAAGHEKLNALNARLDALERVK